MYLARSEEKQLSRRTNNADIKKASAVEINVCFDWMNFGSAMVDWETSPNQGEQEAGEVAWHEIVFCLSLSIDRRVGGPRWWKWNLNHALWTEKDQKDQNLILISTLGRKKNIVHNSTCGAGLTIFLISIFLVHFDARYRTTTLQTVKLRFTLSKKLHGKLWHEGTARCSQF